MAVTPEGRVKNKVKKLLTEHKAYYFMPVQNGMGRAGLDFHGCHLGHAFFIETKTGAKQPTPRQCVTIEEIEAAGGRVFVVNDTPETMELLRAWLEFVTNSSHLFTNKH
jgi:hypothetical protein